MGASPTLCELTAVTCVCIMHFGSMLSVFPCIINAQPWRSALPLIGLTAWADVRGLANSLFTPLHCSERVQDFTATYVFVLSDVHVRRPASSRPGRPSTYVYVHRTILVSDVVLVKLRALSLSRL